MYLFSQLFLAVLSLPASLQVGFSLAVLVGAAPYNGAQAPRCRGFSLQGLLLLQSTGSTAHRLRSCGTWNQLLHCMWELPRPEIQPTCPALAGRFFTTEPPGKPLMLSFKSSLYTQISEVFLVLAFQKINKIWYV